MEVKANLVDVFNKEIYPAIIKIGGDRIMSIERINEHVSNYIIPGFIDSHVHIESSMMSPAEFSKPALRHGTIAVVTDPHEIANVCGLEGVDFMIDNSENTPLKIFFGAPSCVPATEFETSGSILNSNDVRKLLARKEIVCLSEMMNFPGVIYDNEEVHKKLQHAKNVNKPIDGHAPGLSGDNLVKYINSGISTDHECFTLEEAIEKINLGMKVQIREGSAAKNFDNLYSLIKTHTDSVMLCSDDKHPDDLQKGHINDLVIRALKAGCDIFDVLKVISHNPVLHYKLPVGLLRENDYADFIVVDNLHQFNLQEVYINGNLIYEPYNGLDIEYFKIKTSIINNFNAEPISESDLLLTIPEGSTKINVIEIIEGELITNSIQLPIENLSMEEILKKHSLNYIVLMNRYQLEKPIIGFIKGFNISEGAITSTIAHDSHNIISVGDNIKSLCTSINKVIATSGGISLVSKNSTMQLPLEIGGIMTNKPIDIVAYEYCKIENAVKQLGCPLKAPFMTLSFMALLVIPHLKISDKGLFDITKMSFVSLFE